VAHKALYMKLLIEGLLMVAVLAFGLVSVLALGKHKTYVEADPPIRMSFILVASRGMGLIGGWSWMPLPAACAQTASRGGVSTGESPLTQQKVTSPMR
jgi:hypothetical protein